jgi:hypothetical protein
MKTELEKISINGVEYVRADATQTSAIPENGLPYKIVRTYSAGVFAGYLESRNGQEVVLRNARRIYFWAGAASLSQLAMAGTSKPKECKFPCAVDRVELLQAIEILDVTAAAQKSIENVKVWEE